LKGDFQEAFAGRRLTNAQRDNPHTGETDDEDEIQSEDHEAERAEKLKNQLTVDAYHVANV
jgi:hypothetical protein